MIIAFVNQKGGVGKSTLSTHCAVWLQEKGYKVALYDADTQLSSSSWLKKYSDRITIDIINKASEDTPQPEQLVPEQVVALSNDHDFVVCDGPGGLGEVTRTLLALSDLAIFPITPSYLDVQSVTTAVQALNYAKHVTKAEKTAFLVANKTRKRSNLTQELREIAPKLGIASAMTSIRDLDAFREAAQTKAVVSQLGKKASKASADIDDLFSELISPYLMKEVANG